MKKALLVTRVSGFVPQHEMNNVKILQEMGYEVHYATNLNVVVYGKDNSRLEGTDIITHQVDFQKSPFSRDVRKAYHQLVQLMLEESFDLIHCHMPLSAVVTRLAAQKVRKQTGREIPVLYTAHGLHFYTGAPLHNWIYYPIERYLARYTDRLILINQEDYQRGTHFPIRGRVEYVPGVGIPLEGYQPVVLRESVKAAALIKQPIQERSGENASMTGKELRDRQVESQGCREAEETVPVPERPVIEKYIGRKLSPETRVLVTIGELSRRKNHRLAVDMMEELKDLNVILLIGGDGAERSNLQKQIAEKGLENRVFLPGYIQEVKKVLAEADCYVFPSYQEGLPVAIMEAMVAGLPVVAGCIRGVTDLIEHGQGGYLVQSFDSTDFAVKVRRIFTEKDGQSAVPRNVRRFQMGQWNQEKIQHFSRPIVDQRMREIYGEITAE
ncbi:MAG: glycosyltransferase [Lachnospiraceae bacterium]|nr:glycosyltransferase [Lachnospiraceae bacterium]